MQWHGACLVNITRRLFVKEIAAFRYLLTIVPTKLQDILSILQHGAVGVTNSVCGGSVIAGRG